MNYARPDALVSTDWLGAHLDDDNLIILDASWHLPAAERDPRREFIDVHIPGARFYDIDDIADTDSGLPHTAPAPDLFAEKVGALGIGNDSHIVVYDSNGGGMAAMRAWWMFRLYGHDKVAVLNGGLPKWLAESRPTEAGRAETLPKKFEAGWRPEMIRSVDQVRDNLADGGEVVVDVRAPGRFAGTDPEPRPGMRSGHIPGAVNLPYGVLLDGDNHNVMRDARELERMFAGTGIAEKPVVTSCGSGVTACVGAFALHLLGRDDVAVFDGSWTEWGGRDDTPIETGAAG